MGDRRRLASLTLGVAAVLWTAYSLISSLFLDAGTFLEAFATNIPTIDLALRCVLTVFTLGVGLLQPPLHDGAVIVSRGRIVAAGCILPITEKTALPRRFGLRHRAAIGIAEKTDALSVVVSEETGDISLAMNEQFDNKVAPNELEAAIKRSMAQ